MARAVVACRNARALARAGAERFCRWAREAVRLRGRFFVALAGGETPGRMYRLLASPAYRRRVPWNRVELFWGDERFVPPTHPASNFRMTHDALIRRVPIPAAQAHRIPTGPTPARAARAYEALLRRTLPPDGRLDLALLGLGEDGHTASLFPGSPALRERRRWVVPTLAPVEPRRGRRGTPRRRITLTLPLLNRARRVLFLVAGRRKAPALAAARRGRAMAGEAPPAVASRVRPPRGQVLFLIH